MFDAEAATVVRGTATTDGHRHGTLRSSEEMPVTTIDDFPFQTWDKLRYADTDRQGHVNNALFSTFLETGRVEFLYDPAHPMADDGASFVIAGLDMAFRDELRWPGRVEIGTAVERVGTSSITLRQALFQDERCCATARTAIVQVMDGSPAPLRDATRAFLVDLGPPPDVS